MEHKMILEKTIFLLISLILSICSGSKQATK